MINVNQITAQLAKMPDQALQQYAAMHKNDPYTVALALAESNRRKEIRGAARGAGAMPQPKVVDQDIAGMAQPMPEEVGIGQLPAPNMQGMAEGGIVAFAGGGKPDDDYTPAFNAAYNRVRKIEGGYVRNDAGRGPTMYGINWTANQKALKALGYTEDTMRSLTPEDAKRIYKRDYWDAIKGDELAKDNPAFAHIALDTAVNQGQGTARKLIAKAGGEPNKLLALRQREYIDLATPKETDTPAQAERRKQHKANLGAWTERVGGLKNDLDAGKLGLPTMAPGTEAYAADTNPEEDMSFWDKSKKAIVDAGTKGIGALGSAAAGAYEALTPSFAPGTTLPQAVQRTAATAGPLGIMGLTGGTLSAGATNALSNATPEQLDQLSSDVGSDTGLAAAIMNAPNRPPEKPPMPYGEQMSNVAKTLVGHPDRPRAPAPAPEVAPPVEQGGMPDLNQAFRRFELDQQNKAEDVQVAKPEAPAEGITAVAPEEKKDGTDWNDFMIKMGLNLMASKDPNAISGIGQAGLGTLAMQQAEAKAKTEAEAKQSEAEYRKKMGQYYEEMAGAVSRGAKEKNEVQLAEKAAQEAVDTWAKNNKMALLQSPALYDQMRNKYRMEAYKAFGIEPTMQAGAPEAAGAGFKLLGVRPS